MKKVLLIGNYTNIEHHPLKDVDNELKRILDGFDITITEDYPSLKLSDLQKYDFIVNYADTLNSKATPDFAGALLGYVAAGGGLLALHQGIIANSVPELLQLMGASFVEHPEMETLEYVCTGDHTITQGIKSFEIYEEPYFYEMANLMKAEMLVEYIYKGEKFPAAWVRNYGKGRVCYLQPGHSAETFKNETYGELIKRAALWCVGEL